MNKLGWGFLLLSLLIGLVSSPGSSVEKCRSQETFDPVLAPVR